MIALIRALTTSGVITLLFTLACLGGAWSALPNESPAMHKARYAAPSDCPFAAAQNSPTVHLVSCPLITPLDERTLIYFHNLQEAAVAHKTDLCPICTQRMSNADTASMSTIPTITPTPKPSKAISH